MSGGLLDALLRASVEGALFAAGVWGLCRLLPGLPAALRCALWWLVSLRLLVGLAGISAVELPLLPPAAEPPATHVAAPSAPSAFPAPASLPAAAAPRLSWREGLASLWLAGLLVQLAWTWRQLGQARAIVSRSAPLAEPRTAQRFAELRQQLGVSQRVGLRVSPEIESPQVVGLLRPVVLLPAAALRSLSPADLSMAMCHELLHVRRADLWWGWLPALAQRLFYFHPLARLAAREHVLAREAACDAEVLRVLGPEPQAYGRLLLRLGVAPRTAKLAAAGAAPSVRTLKRRLEMLETSSNRRRFPLGWIGLIAVLAVVGMVPFQIVAQEAPPAPPEPPPAPAAPAAAPAPAPEAPETPPAPPAPAPAPPAPRAVPAPAPAPKVTAPPAPSAPPVPPAPGLGESKDGQPFVLLLGDDQTVVNGTSADIRRARQHQAGEEPLLYFRHDGKSYVIRDAATVRRARELFQPQMDLGKRQAELGARQAELGAQQARLGGEQAALGARQAALAAKEAKRAQDGEKRDPSLADEMKELGRQQGELGRRQGELGGKQSELGEQQGELGRQQAKLAAEAEMKLRSLLDQAMRAGHAQEVGR